MPAVEDVWHARAAALAELCPGVRATRRRGWLRLALEIALAGSGAVGRAAGVLPGRPASTERRLRRWLANAAGEGEAFVRTWHSPGPGARGRAKSSAAPPGSRGAAASRATPRAESRGGRSAVSPLRRRAVARAGPGATS